MIQSRETLESIARPSLAADLISCLKPGWVHLILRRIHLTIRRPCVTHEWPKELSLSFHSSTRSGEGILLETDIDIVNACLWPRCIVR